jgi:hypothetical protein
VFHSSAQQWRSSGLSRTSFELLDETRAFYTGVIGLSGGVDWIIFFGNSCLDEDRCSALAGGM